MGVYWLDVVCLLVCGRMMFGWYVSWAFVDVFLMMLGDACYLGIVCSMFVGFGYCVRLGCDAWD